MAPTKPKMCTVRLCDCGQPCICPKPRPKCRVPNCRCVRCDCAKDKCHVAGCDCPECVCRKVNPDACRAPTCDTEVCECLKPRLHKPGCVADCDYDTCVCSPPPECHTHCDCFQCICIRNIRPLLLKDWPDCTCDLCICLRDCDCKQCADAKCGGPFTKRGLLQLCDCVVCVCIVSHREPHDVNCACALCHCLNACECVFCECVKEANVSLPDKQIGIDYIGQRPKNSNEFELMMSKGQRKADEYLKEHKIFEFFHFLMCHIVTTAPENPIEFLIDILQNCLLYRNKIGSPPLLFESKHIEALYKNLDPLGTDLISFHQYSIALTTLGLNNFNMNPPLTDDGLVTKAFFQNEALQCLEKLLLEMIGGANADELARVSMAEIQGDAISVLLPLCF